MNVREFWERDIFSQRRGEIEENRRFEVKNWLMVTKQSPTNLGLSFIFGGGVNCLVVFPTHFNPNNSLLILLQISLLFTCTL